VPCSATLSAPSSLLETPICGPRLRALAVSQVPNRSALELCSNSDARRRPIRVVAVSYCILRQFRLRRPFLGDSLLYLRPEARSPSGRRTGGHSLE
jgi:hypothetical protein